ncbi:MAG: heavy metal translocating P-type ATPase [Halopenitus sp.]
MPACRLCELPVGESPSTAPDVDGEFCCRGCLAVYRRLDDVEGVDDAETGAAVPNAGLDRDQPEDAAETFLAVDGMHCTTCEAFLTLRGDETDGVYAVEANYATETTRVVYDPDLVTEGALPDRLSGYGYSFRFRDGTTEADGVGDGDGAADESGGSSAAADREFETVQRLVVGGFLAMLVMPWYVFTLYPSYVGVDTGVLAVDTTTPAGRYLPLAFIALLTTGVLAYTGAPLLRGAWVSVRARRPNMDLLVATAALSAYAYSTVALATGSTHLYYDVTVAVVIVVTLGRFYENRVRSRATTLLSDVTAARVREATRLTDDGRETVAVDDLEPGDRLVVPPGERVPVDGTVAEGVADVDESVLTGESLPVTKEPGDEVAGGAVVTDHALVVTVGPEVESTADRIAAALWEIQTATPGAQRLADALATVFVPLVLLLGLGVTAWQLATGATVATALLAGLTVLVVSCPCAMGLATPLAVSAGLRDALARGIVFTNEAVFEAAPDAETIVFDKTGTLTTGTMSVAAVHGDDRTLRRAAAVERFSDHPVADAVLDAMRAGDGEPAPGPQPDGGVEGTAAATAGEPSEATAGESAEATVGESAAATTPESAAATPPESPTKAAASLPDATDFERHPGEGVAGTVDGDRVVVGTPDLVRREAGPVPDDVAERVAAADGRGALPVVVGWDGAARGVVTLVDREREGWTDALAAFADREVVVLTGDAGNSAERFRESGIVDEVFTGVPPAGKVETIRRFAAEGTTVMVGDGTNDAPALAAADLGIAVGNGTARATDAADVVVATDDLRAVGDVFALTAGTRRRIRENLCWALGYNAVAIPLAVAGLLNPLFAALAMAASSLIVVSNSTRSVVPTDR